MQQAREFVAQAYEPTTGVWYSLEIQAVGQEGAPTIA